MYRIDISCQNCRRGDHDHCQKGRFSDFVVIDCHCRICKARGTRKEASKPNGD
jgi:hypothetical protein